MDERAFLSSRGLEAANEIDKRIAWFGSARFASRATERVLRVVLVFFVVLFMSIWLYLAIAPSPPVDFFIRLVGVAGIGAAAYFWVYPVLAKRPNHKMNGLGIESEFPELANRLITAVEFREEMAQPGGGILKYFSPILINAFYLDADRKSKDLFWRKMLLKSSLVIQSATLVVAIIFFFSLHHFSKLDWRSALGIYLGPFHKNPFGVGFDIIVQPGDAEVAIGEDFSLTIRVPGSSDKTPSVFFRSGKAEADEVRAVAQEDGSFSHKFTNVRQTMNYWVKVGRKKTREYTIKALKPIRMTDISLTYFYPEYMGLLALIGETNEGNITTYRGTTVRISADFDEQADKASAEFAFGTDGQGVVTKEMKYTGKSWECRNEIRKNGTYRISAGWKQGAPGSSQTFTITAFPDAPPKVRIVSPTNELALLDDDNLPDCIEIIDDYPYLKVRFYAIDDLGLRRARLIARDKGGKIVAEENVSLYSEDIKEGTAEFKWAVNDHWGGPDRWVSVEVGDSLADKPELVSDLYTKKEIEAHSVESQRVRVYWNKPKEDEVAAQKDKDERERLKKQAQQVKENLEKAKDGQKKINEKTEQKSQEERTSQADKKKQDRGETKEQDQGEAKKQEQGNAKEQEQGESKEQKQGDTKNREQGKQQKDGDRKTGEATKEGGETETAEGKGEEGGGSTSADSKVGTGSSEGESTDGTEPGGDSVKGIADGQESLGEQVDDTAEKSRSFADQIESYLTKANGEPDKSEEPAGADDERLKLDEMKEALRKAADKVDGKTDGSEQAIPDRMMENADRIRNSELDSALQEGRKIEESLTEALSMLGESNSKKDGENPGSNGQEADASGEKKGTEPDKPGSNGKDPKEETSDKNTKNGTKDNDGQGNTREGPPKPGVETSASTGETGAAGSGGSRKWGPSSAGLGSGSADGIRGPGFDLPSSVRMNFGTGTGAGTSTDFEGEDLDQAFVGRDIKIPESYSKGVQKYMEMISNAKETK